MARTEKFRFYRSNLATVVWDAENDRPLADFSDGQFLTTNRGVAQRLIDLGYPRIPLKATEPPDILFKKGEVLEGDVIISPKMNETSALNREKAQAALSRDTDDDDTDADDDTESDVPEEEESPAEVVKKTKKVSKTKPKSKRTTNKKTTSKSKKSVK